MHRCRFILLVVAVVCACGSVHARERPLTMLCGGGIRPPVKILAERFGKEHGCRVNVNYSGCGIALGKLLSGIPADLFMPGDASWIKKAARKGLVEESYPVAWFVTVIAVRKGNPKHILSVRDFARADVRVGLGRPEACAVGPVALDILRAAGVLGRVKPVFQGMTVNAVALQVKMGSVDAGIVWDAVARWYPDDIETVSLDDPWYYAVPLSVAVLKCSRDRELARRFCRYMAGPEGKRVFKQCGYTVTGDCLHLLVAEPFRHLAERSAYRFGKNYGCRVVVTACPPAAIASRLPGCDVCVCGSKELFSCLNHHGGMRVHAFSHKDKHVFVLRPGTSSEPLLAARFARMLTVGENR